MLEKGSQPEAGDLVSPDEAIKDPYVLEFLNLKDEYSESQLEDALIHRLEDFLLELGGDFAFVGRQRRQRRLRIGESWFRVDLLFFHRRLRCLVIIDLKLTLPQRKIYGSRHTKYDGNHKISKGWNHKVTKPLSAELAFLVLDSSLSFTIAVSA
ncbi:PDDEXK nuclease domain-containing protein [Chitinimonas arctica]|uniref:PDDEXK nuclease domain-containing protein n=1 Tax=Chitinimonas arctica TaxID=2594795 RepID=UPI0027E405BF|nr:PDDEXK nuclease domain-containing protein [Chitinimonas arctica]